MNNELTSIQARVFAFVQQFFSTEDRLPTRAEIAGPFGWRSTNGAHEHLEALMRKGLLERRSAGNYRFSRAVRIARDATPDFLRIEALECEIKAATLRLAAAKLAEQDTSGCYFAGAGDVAHYERQLARLQEQLVAARADALDKARGLVR